MLYFSVLWVFKYSMRWQIYIIFFVSSNIQRTNKNACRPGYSDDDAGVAEGHDQDREHPGEGEEVEEVCQLLQEA